MNRALAQDSQLPLTRLILLVSAVVQLIFGVAGLFFTDLFNSFFWPDPLPAWPKVVANFAFLNYLATAAAAAYALYDGRWSGARVYFAFSFPYNIMGLVMIFLTASTTGVPPIMWLYAFLSAIYLPAITFAWLQQSRMAVAHGI